MPSFTAWTAILALVPVAHAAHVHHGATGEWRLIMLYTGINPDGSYHFSRIIGWYKEVYHRVDGRWYIHDLYCEVEEASPYKLAPEEALSA